MADTHDRLSEMLSLLARVDERTQQIQREIQDLKDDADIREEKLILTVNERISSMKYEHDSLKKNIHEDYVKKESFAPVQRIVYGLVGMILSSVGLALLALVVIK